MKSWQKFGEGVNIFENFIFYAFLFTNYFKRFKKKAYCFVHKEYLSGHPNGLSELSIVTRFMHFDHPFLLYGSFNLAMVKVV